MMISLLAFCYNMDLRELQFQIFYHKDLTILPVSCKSIDMFGIRESPAILIMITPHDVLIDLD